MVGSDAHPQHQPTLFKRKEKVQSVLESRMLSHLPKVPILILKNPAPLSGLSLKDLKCCSQPLWERDSS